MVYLHVYVCGCVYVRAHLSACLPIFNNNNNRHEYIYIQGLAYVLVLELKRNILRWERRKKEEAAAPGGYRPIHTYVCMCIFLCGYVCVCVCLCIIHKKACRTKRVGECNKSKISKAVNTGSNKSNMDQKKKKKNVCVCVCLCQMLAKGLAQACRP